MSTISRPSRLACAAALTLALGLPLALSGCASCTRELNRLETDFGKGVPRTVTLYSATGETVEQWNGIIDAEYSEDGHVDLLFFDQDGEVQDRIIVSVGGGTLVIDNE